MKFLPYVLRNVLRNKLRTLFTCMSIAVSLFLLALLYGYIEVQDELAAQSVNYNRLGVVHANGLTFSLPIAHVDKVRGMPGVKAATPLAWFGGVYKDDKLPFAQFATDPQIIMQVFDELTLPDEQLRAWQGNRAGCVAGRRLAEKKGWKIGERVPIKGAIYPVDLNLTLEGIYDGPDTSDREMLWFQWTYMDELLKQSRSAQAGDAGTVWVKGESAAVLPELMRRIDERFASSDAPTRTMTEQAFQQMFTEMVGNVQAFIRNTALAVVFSLVCVAANAMAMSLRERTREVAVLRAIGFSRQLVMSLVLSEAVAIAFLGGLLGVMGAKLLFGVGNLGSLILPFFPVFYIPWSTTIFLLAVAAAIGLVSGIVPAWRAARLSVVDGLRKVV